MKTALILVGHGGSPTDFPKDKLQRLKRLEAERMAKGGGAMTPEEKELDDSIRNWPRTPSTDPYKFGLEALASALTSKLGAAQVLTAYNEFCGPSLEDAVESLAARNFEEIAIVTTMYTRGGIHSECEIPHQTNLLQKRFPKIKITYAWPFDNDLIADFLVRHLRAAPQPLS